MKHFHIQLAVMFLFFTLLQTAVAQVPANDSCNGAFSITPSPYGINCAESVAASTSGATKSLPNPSCTSVENNDDIWYRFSATSASVVLRFFNAVNNATGGSAVIGYAVYEETCPGSNPALQCNNLGSAGQGFQIIDGLTIGATYLLRFWSTLTGANSASFNFCIQESTAPVNDECSTAFIVNPAQVNSNCNSGIAATTIGATKSPIALSCSSNYNDDDIWYTFTANTSAVFINFSNARLATSSGNANLGFALYPAECPDLSEAVSCIENIGGGNGSHLAGGLVPGNRYLLRFFSYGTNRYMTFDFCLIDAALALNDECTNAIELAVTNSFCTAPLLTTLAGSTTSAGFGAPACAGLSGSEDVWYKATVPSSGNLVIQTSVADNDINDLVMEAYSGECGNFTLITCNDDGNPDAGYNAFHPRIELAGRTPGEMIFIRMLGKGTINSGPFTICAWDATILSDVSAGGNCVSSDPVIIHSAKGNQYLWVPLFDASGHIIAEINADGTDLDTVIASVFVNESDTIREFQGIKYLDRNLHFASSGTGPARIRIYFKQAEFLRLQSSDTLIEDLTGLAISKNDDGCRSAMNQSGEELLQDTAGLYGNDYFVAFRTGLPSGFYVTRLSGTLPVAFISFTAKCQFNSVLLEWATATEQNNAGFEIERSKDGNRYHKIAFITGAGNSDTQHNYHFKDLFPDAPKLFYRIRQTDKDGRFLYSKVVAVSCSRNGTALKIFPNPVASTLILNFNNRIRNGVVQITDVLGKEHLKTSFNAGVHGIMKINVAPLAPGVYFLRLRCNALERSEVVRFIKIE